MRYRVHVELSTGKHIAISLPDVDTDEQAQKTVASITSTINTTSSAEWIDLAGQARIHPHAIVAVWYSRERDAGQALDAPYAPDLNP